MKIILLLFLVYSSAVMAGKTPNINGDCYEKSQMVTGMFFDQLKGELMKKFAKSFQKIYGNEKITNISYLNTNFYDPHFENEFSNYLPQRYAVPMDGISIYNEDIATFTGSPFTDLKTCYGYRNGESLLGESQYEHPVVCSLYYANLGGLVITISSIDSQNNQKSRKFKIQGSDDETGNASGGIVNVTFNDSSQLSKKTHAYECYAGLDFLFPGQTYDLVDLASNSHVGIALSILPKEGGMYFDPQMEIYYRPERSKESLQQKVNKIFKRHPLVLGKKVSIDATPADHITPGQHDSWEIPFEEKIEVDGSPDWMGIGTDAVWAPMDGELYRISPEGDITDRIKIGPGRFRGVGIGFGSVWILNAWAGQLIEVDQATKKIAKVIPLTTENNSEGSIGVGLGAIWVATLEPKNSAGTTQEFLSQIDPVTGATVAAIKLNDTPHASGVTTGDGFVWVTEPALGKVLRIDPATQEIKTIEVGGGPSFITVGANSVWTIGQEDGNLIRIDSATLQVTKTLIVEPHAMGDITFGEDGFVWVSSFKSPLVKIDPQTNSVVSRYDGTVGGDAIRLGFGSIWFSSRIPGSIWKINP